MHSGDPGHAYLLNKILCYTFMLNLNVILVNKVLAAKVSKEENNQISAFLPSLPDQVLLMHHITITVK